MQPNHLPLCTIAGSDPTGGAGFQGDLKALAALGATGTAVVTAFTAQDRERVWAVHPVPSEVVRAQLEAVVATRRPQGFKTGMLWSADTIHQVAEALRDKDAPIVVDPVLRASVGQPLAEADATGAFRDALLPLTTLVTPNAEEAGALLGTAPPQPGTECEEAAMALLGLGCRAVLLTGGDAKDGDAVDVFALAGLPRTVSFSQKRVEGSFHGTGCALSSALLFELAQGTSIERSIGRAKQFVHRALERAAASDDPWLLRYA